MTPLWIYVNVATVCHENGTYWLLCSCTLC